MGPAIEKEQLPGFIEDCKTCGRYLYEDHSWLSAILMQKLQTCVVQETIIHLSIGDQAQLVGDLLGNMQPM